MKQDDANTTLKTLEFTYDALGRRASKTIDGVTQNYLYDGEDIIAILDSNNNPISIITHGESIDTPLAIRTNNESYFYQRDHQGSITSLTDSNQNKVQEYIYTDAYGTTQVVQTLDTNNPYAYAGRELDDTDLYYYRARYYDPTTQRFLSQDPIGFASGDFNFYRYVGNSPANFRDPSGQKSYNKIISMYFSLLTYTYKTSDQIFNAENRLIIIRQCQAILNNYKYQIEQTEKMCFTDSTQKNNRLIRLNNELLKATVTCAQLGGK